MKKLGTIVIDVFEHDGKIVANHQVEFESINKFIGYFNQSKFAQSMLDIVLNRTVLLFKNLVDSDRDMQ